MKTTMSSQYDKIAAAYEQTTREEISRKYIEDPNMLRIIGKAKGRDVLGVGCGDGYMERLVKLAGANHVVGTDLSLAMLNLGRKLENEQPLGIEYYQYNLASLPAIDQFDLVTAKYVLNYADDKTRLKLMFRNIYKNLKPGGRLIALVPDYADDESGLPTTPKYGFAAEALELPLVEGGKLRVTLYANDVAGVNFVVRFWKTQSYEEALRKVGFGQIAWHKPMPSADGVERFGHEFWQDWIKRPMSMIIEATK